ncbi:MAG: hypothetical protein KME09_00505 [Pleurocapsa minor HA4230-MV1]|jgi:hypothetical protein|nr:hypothetical protein [Pleurocapsa minor HA4230-MV1]
MERSVQALKVFSSFAVSTLALIYIPFVAASVDAAEDSSKFSSGFLSSQNNSTKIEMTSEDAEYIEKIREHYGLDL